MPNAVTRELRETMIKENNLQIPYNAQDFVKWLVNSNRKKESEANDILALIREADIELWQPGDPEIFEMIAKWCGQAQHSGDAVGVALLYDYTVDTMEAYVEWLKDTRLNYQPSKLFNSWLNAHQWYIRFLNESLTRDLLERFPEFKSDDSEDDDDYKESQKDKSDKPRFPLEDEFIEYLVANPKRSIQKICSNLGRFNKILLSNAHDEFQFNLEDIVKRSEEDNSDGILRIISNDISANLVISAWRYNLSESTARNCKTAITRYIEFLIYRKHKKSSLKQPAFEV